MHEIKHDGYRVQAHISDLDVRLFTRTGLDWTDKFGVIAEELRDLGADRTILDGEAIVQDEHGASDFHALQREIKKGASARISIVAFDLLMLDGDDWRARPLLQRKDRLKELVGGLPHAALLRFGEHMAADGAAVLEHACKLGLEGIVSKRADRPYRSGRSGDWLKTKCELTDDLVVVGYVGQSGVDETIGSLVLGYWEGGDFVYAGRVGTGFSADEAHAIWQVLQTIRSQPPRFARRLNQLQRQGVVWVEPRLVVEVHHRGWTPDGVLRQSAFKTFRGDKDASQITRPISL